MTTQVGSIPRRRPPARRRKATACSRSARCCRSTGALAFLGPPMIGAVTDGRRGDQRGRWRERQGRRARRAGRRHRPGRRQPGGRQPARRQRRRDRRRRGLVGLAGGASTRSPARRSSQCSPSNTGLQFTTVTTTVASTSAPHRPTTCRPRSSPTSSSSDGKTKVAIVARSDRVRRGLRERPGRRARGGRRDGRRRPDPVRPRGGELSGRGRADRRRRARRGRRSICVRRGRPGDQAAIAAGYRSRTACSGTAPTACRAARSARTSTPTNPAVVEGIRGTAPSAAPADGEAHVPRAFEAFAPGVDTIFSGHAYDCVVVAALAAHRGRAAMRRGDPGRA